MAGARVPGPNGLPLIGSMLDLRRDPMGAYLTAQRDHGDVVRFSAGPPGLRVAFYAVFSAEGAQQVLATDATVFRKENTFYEEIRQSFGNGLLTSQDTDYQRQRRLIQPLFTRHRVDGYADAVRTEAALLADRWADTPGGTVDLVPEMSGFALRTVSRILFGADIDATVDVVHRSFPVIGAYVLQRGFAPASVPRHWHTPANRRAAAARRELYGVCDRIIAERRAADREEPDGDDLLGLLARARSEDGEGLDEAELRDQVLIFLLAGHETTATSLAFALHLLARHPDVQARARKEVDRVLGGDPPGADDLERLPYTTMVLKEAMRLFPAAPVIGRRAAADTVIGGHRIPAGSDVFVSPWVTHRHPAYWTDPERFDPERFTPEREAVRPRYAWFPFGGGPRACIGRHFSMLESVLALAVLLQRHHLTAVDTDVPLGQGITLQAKGPVRVRTAPRTPADLPARQARRPAAPTG